MCGRFTQTRPWSELVELYRITEPLTDRQPERRYNIAPTDDVAAVRPVGDGRGRELVRFRWGLLPPWAKAVGEGARMINARAETVAGKPAFRSAFRARRCLIIADGFYEWQARPGQAKQPYYIAAPDAQSLAFAGVWERWSRDGSASVETCAIITTAATPTLGTLHDRMPAILAEGDRDLWLDPTTTADCLRALLRPYSGMLHARAVSRRVNTVHSDDAACIEALADSRMPASGDLFAESSPPLCHSR